MASPRTNSNKSTAPTTLARQLLRLPCPPPSPAKHVHQALAWRHGPSRPAILEEGSNVEGRKGLDKGFGFGKWFFTKYEMGDKVGRDHFGYTYAARIRKGSRKREAVAINVIPKAKMTSIAIEDIRREVKILKVLAGHKNLVQFYDAYEDNENVYGVMEIQWLP